MPNEYTAMLKKRDEYRAALIDAQNEIACALQRLNGATNLTDAQLYAPLNKIYRVNQAQSDLAGAVYGAFSACRERQSRREDFLRV